jgi:hypothetical protein
MQPLRGATAWRRALGVALLVLGGGPALAQSGRAGGPIPVEVIGPSPLPVEVTNPPVAPVVHRIFNAVSIDDTQPSGVVALEAVPAGKRFVVEHIAAQGLALSPQTLIAVLSAPLASPPQFYPIPLALQGAFDSTNQFHASLPVRLHLDAGHAFNLDVTRSGGTAGAALLRLNLSGYLVDLP